MAKTPNNNTRDNINSAIANINLDDISTHAHAHAHAHAHVHASTNEMVFEDNRYLTK